MRHKITFIPGDGIGPEVSDAARRCIESTGVEVEWEILEAGEACIDKCGTPLPDSVLNSIKANKVALKGPITTPLGKGIRSVNVELRRALNLYACVRPCRTYKGVNSRYEDIDIVIIRENTEDLYAGIEFDVDTLECSRVLGLIAELTKKTLSEDSAISIKPISRGASEKIVDYAFQYALNNKRRKVTAVHKANIMKYTDGLFSRAAYSIAKRYEGRVAFEEKLVDNMCMQLVQHPEEYDVLVLPNLYGDIVSDLCAGLVGGLGVAPGANIGENCAVFEAVHGSAPKHKGKDVANPTAMILSGVMMLKYLGEADKARLLEEALASVILEGKYVTYDLKGRRDDPTAVGTRRMAEAVIEKIKRGVR